MGNIKHYDIVIEASQDFQAMTLGNKNIRRDKGIPSKCFPCNG